MWLRRKNRTVNLWLLVVSEIRFSVLFLRASLHVLGLSVFCRASVTPGMNIPLLRPLAVNTRDPERLQDTAESQEFPIMLLLKAVRCASTSVNVASRGEHLRGRFQAPKVGAWRKQVLPHLPGSVPPRRGAPACPVTARARHCPISRGPAQTGDSPTFNT